MTAELAKRTISLVARGKQAAVRLRRNKLREKPAYSQPARRKPERISIREMQRLGQALVLVRQVLAGSGARCLFDSLFTMFSASRIPSARVLPGTDSMQV